jgi:hypothetical protein
MSKPGKVLKALCKKLGVRLTVKRGKKRVYKSVKVLKAQCAKKKKKVKRKKKFGTIAFPNPYMSVYGNGTYIGGKKDGKRHGNGIMYYNSGNIYKGDWVNGYRDGIGTFLFSPTGNKYVGEWKNDKANGKGTFTWVNGDVYVGDYKDNKKHGKGYMMGEGGTKLIYEGELEEDWLRKGTYYYPDGSKYIGHFETHFLQHGAGQHIDIDKENYKTYLVGVWDNNEFTSGDMYYYEKFGEPIQISEDDEEDCYVFKHFHKVEAGTPGQEISRISIPHDSSNHTANSNPALRKFYKKLPLPLRSSEGFGKKRKRKSKKKKKKRKK